MNTEEFSALLNAEPRRRVIDHRESFERFVSQLDIRALLTRELKAALADYRRPPPTVADSTLRLQVWDSLALDLTITQAKDYPAVVCTHQDVLQYFYSGCDFRHYRLQGFQPDAFNPEARATLNEEGHFGAGDVMAIDGRADLYALKSPEPIIFVSLAEFTFEGVHYKFDLQTGKPFTSFFTYPPSTSMQLVAKFLGYYGDANCIDPLRSLLGHQLDNIKWEAAVALSCLDRQAGIDAMKVLAGSANKPLSNAARQTLMQSA
ncbi:hypothetical protein [Roseateles sp. P5_E1]